MTIDALPPAPTATDSVATFDAKAFALVAALANFVTQTNTVAGEVQTNNDLSAAILLAAALPGYSDTSTTILTIGTGTKVFAVTAGKSWVTGQVVVAVNGANYMKGTVTSYVGTTLTVNVTTIVGSGTFASWGIALSYNSIPGLAASGANSDITSLTGLVGAGLLPVGSVIFHAANTAPTGYLKANGALVSRTTYANLFAAIGTTFGVGDGSTTFALPDLRGEFVRGWIDDRAITGETGRSFGTAQLDQLQGHGHTAASLSGGTQVPSYGSGAPVSPGAQAALSPITDGTNGTPRVGAETRPRNIALLACIKF